MPLAYASEDKRVALLQAATQLLHEQGLHQTTLAHVAKRAKVPLGNLYYYFKTKDALAEAVIAAHEAALQEQFASWTAAHRDPRLRLREFVRTPLRYADAVVRFGCPHGSLCQELEKLGATTPLAKAGARLMAAYVEWADGQFRELGHGSREAEGRARDLVAAIQGTMLLAHTLRSRDLLSRQLRRIEQGLHAPSTQRIQESTMNDSPLHPTSLEDSISEFMKGVAKHAPPAVLATIDTELRKLADSGIARRALAVGAKAPDFTLPDAHGKATRLASILSKGPAVVAFYRGGWCPFCDLQLRAYQAVLPQIHDLGAELVAISPQTPDYVLSDAEKKALTFPVLSDVGNKIAREYGLVFSLSEPLRQVHAGFGSVLPKFNGDDSWELPLPGTFVLDLGGIVRQAYVDVDYRKRLEPAAILETLKSLG